MCVGNTSIRAVIDEVFAEDKCAPKQLEDKMDEERFKQLDAAAQKMSALASTEYIHATSIFLIFHHRYNLVISRPNKALLIQSKVTKTRFLVATCLTK